MLKVQDRGLGSLCFGLTEGLVRAELVFFIMGRGGLRWEEEKGRERESDILLKKPFLTERREWEKVSSKFEKKEEKRGAGF